VIFEASDYRELALAIIPVAQRAGAAIIDIYKAGPNVRFKPDRSPVTDADHAAEEIILDALSRLLPNVRIIAEEQTAAGIVPAIERTFFLVDPLDGTKEFLKANGEFTVNIALIAEEKPIFGLVYAPDKADCYLTLEQGKAVRCSLPPTHSPGANAKLNFVPLTGEPDLPRPMTAIISRSHPRPEAQAFLARLGDIPRIVMGSSLKFGVLARGDADVYPRFGPTSEWDTAAGHAVLEAAGGCMLTPAGQPILYGKSAEKFTNPPFLALRWPPTELPLGMLTDQTIGAKI
jgi:3'(2'), 5'-bisphosphate nucleotidase